jgi:hypothetical protein
MIIFAVDVVAGRLNLEMRTNWLGPVTHTCNASYSGGRDQEDQGLRPAWEKS